MLHFKKQITIIEKCFSKDNLPGLSSQLKMAPVTRLEELKKMNIIDVERTNNKPHFDRKVNARDSAVLILFYPKNDKIHLALIKRATDNTVHSGQISFPGGKVEEVDNSLVDTALRETHEEIGISPDSIQTIGELSKLYIPPSNFDVYPFVGVTFETPIFSINHEVDRIIEVSLNTLINPATKTYQVIQHRNGVDFEVPCYYIQDEIIWGATAMIISELLEVVNGEL